MSQLLTSPFPKWGHQDLETFLAPSAGKQTGEGDINGSTGVLRESPIVSNCLYIYKIKLIPDDCDPHMKHGVGKS